LRLKRVSAFPVIACEGHTIVELVAGDIVRLTAGDLGLAGGVLLSSRDFFVNQALPTGESYPIEKHTANRGDPAPEIREANVALAGTSVISEKRESSDLPDRTANTAPSIGHILIARPPSTSFSRSAFADSACCRFALWCS
jgi:P-type Mg2+ transporter